MKIHKLSDLVVSQIAAGEVIESPAGAFKEILENSIDAGATRIEVSIKQAGLEKIQIKDNGTGISKEDLILASQSFTTSKITKASDLFHIQSMGFRGEALSSIRSVSRLSMESRIKDSSHAWKIAAQGADISEATACAFDEMGTRVIIEDLFFNVPIRKKFLKNEKKINKDILEILTSYALAFWNIQFVYYLDDKVVCNYAPVENLLDRVSQVFSEDFASNLIPIYNEDKEYTIHGYISGLDFFHSHQSFLRFFINKRFIHFLHLSSIVRSAYGELLPPGKFPVALLFVDTETANIDVNIHPQKKEVNFKESDAIESVLKRSFRKAIEGEGNISSSLFVKRSAKITQKHSDKPQSEQSKLDFLEPMELRESPPMYGTENGSGNSANSEFQINDKSNDQISYNNEDNKNNENQEENSSPALDRPTVIHGRLFNTFVLASSENGIYLIDQHTAHERIRYEAILNKLSSNQVVSQTLVSPVAIYLPPEMEPVLVEALPSLRSIGFEFEDLGPAGASLFSIPEYVSSGDEEKSFQLALSLFQKDSEVSAPKLFDLLAKSLACRGAVKKGDQASTAELGDIIKELYNCKHPARCPHGRPTVIHIGKEDVFGFFKRDVNK